MHKICLCHKSLGVFLSVLIATLLPFQAFAYKPSIVTQDLPEAYVGVFYHVQLLIEGFGRKPVWSADGLPDGIELDPVSGILFGAAIKSGTFEVLIKVQSGWSWWRTKTDSKLFLLKILPHPDETPADSPAPEDLPASEDLPATSDLPAPAVPDSSANPNAAPEPQSSAEALIAPASDNPASNSRWISITANGESGSETTTALELVFSDDLQINKDNYTECFEITGGEAEFDPAVFSKLFDRDNLVYIYTFGINIPANTLQDQTEIEVDIIKLLDEYLVLDSTSMSVKLNIAQADQPEPEPEPEPEPNPNPEPEPEPEPNPNPAPEPEPEPQPEPEPEPQPKPQPESQPQSEPQPEPEPQPSPESSSEASSGILAYSASSEPNTSSSKSLFKANNTNAVTASSNVGTNGALSRSSALDELKFAFQTATKSFAVIKTKNAVNVSPKTLKALAAAAKAEGMPAVLHADTVTESRKVDARLYVKPESLTGITEPIKLQISTKGIRPETIKMFFEKHFENEISVISCEQQGSFGARLQIAAKIKLPEDTGNLVFYSYDASTNSFSRILTAYRIDSNGYLRFATEQAGDIIVSNGILKKRTV